MGIYNLLFKARLDGVVEVHPQRDMRWYFRIACTSCGEENEKEVYLHADEESQEDGSRGVFNFIMKCKICTRTVTLNLIKNSVVGYKDSENFQKIAEIDARGIRVVSWKATRGLNVKCESGTVFEDINIEDADWVEYDEQAGGLIGVYEILTAVNS